MAKDMGKEIGKLREEISHVKDEVYEEISKNFHKMEGARVDE
jgi:Sec-independent protein translocase protein TatA